MAVFLIVGLPARSTHRSGIAKGLNKEAKSESNLKNLKKRKAKAVPECVVWA